MELVSIIMPAYNASDYIAETILSVKNQTYTHWELIIINDGSTDNTEKKIQPFLKDDIRIKYLVKNNSGVSHSRNVGMNNAQGEYISFIDADDVWLENNLKEKLIAIKNCDAVYSECELINENSKPINKKLTGANLPLLEDILLLKGNYITAPSGVLIKKSTLDKIGNFDINLSNNADQDLWIRILLNDFKIKLIPKVLWYYRMHSNNMSGNIALLESDSIYMFDKTYRNNSRFSNIFKRKSYSKLYIMLAGSWWKNGNNKIRSVYFIFKSFLNYPPTLIKLILK
jgi:glycosyltransferase involved in cell wall biosynthesis